jgi:agmatine deiminase
MCFPQDYERVQQGYLEIVKAIAEFEPVIVVVNPDEQDQIKELFEEPNIEVIPIQHNDAWLRDNGPTFLMNDDGKRAGVNWKFNAWGEKYTPCDLDDQVAPLILDYLNIERFNASLVMEGGSIHVDGEGTLLTTEECLLNPNRNPYLIKNKIESYLKQYLNIEKVIWLKKGLYGDETDGHIDNIACFAAPGKILLQICDDPEDDNYGITQENLKILTNSTDAMGRSIEIIPIQQPPMLEHKGSRLTLSYLNFYFVNGGIILPIFGGNAEDTDKKAEDVLKEVFPGRRIRKINGMALIKEGGNVHCTTQQMPRGKE